MRRISLLHILVSLVFILLACSTAYASDLESSSSSTAESSTTSPSTIAVTLDSSVLDSSSSSSSSSIVSGSSISSVIESLSSVLSTTEITTTTTLCYVDNYEPNNEPQEAYSVENMPFSSGTLSICEEADEDWYAFNAFEGCNYTIETSYMVVDVDTEMWLYNSSELKRNISYNDDKFGSFNYSRIDWTAPSTGLFYVKVTSVVGLSKGNYTLLINGACSMLASSSSSSMLSSSSSSSVKSMGSTTSSALSSSSSSSSSVVSSLPTVTYILYSSNHPELWSDTYVRSENPTTNYGGSPSISLRNSDAIWYAFLRFNLSAIPPDSTVTSAVLSLYEDSGNSNDMSLTFYRCSNDSWNEGTAISIDPGSLTWNNKEYIMQTATNSLFLGDIGLTRMFHDYNITLLDLSQDINSDGMATIYITPNSADPKYRYWRSKEYSYFYSKRPYIVVSYKHL